MTISISDKIDWTMDETPKKAAFQKDQSNWTLPSGEYLAEIVDTQMRSAPDNKYVYMEMKFKVEAPETYKNRLFFIKFYFQHADFPALVNKHKKQLKELSISCFGAPVEKGADFVGGKSYLTLSLKAGNPRPDGNGTYPASNRIEDIRAVKAGISNHSVAQEAAVAFTDDIPW